MQLQGLFLAWICNNLLNPLVLLLLLNKPPNEISKPPCLTLVWMCDVQGLVCFGLQLISRAVFPGLFLCALRLFFLHWSSPPVYWMLYFGKPFPVWGSQSHLELGACARCWAKGISCSLGTCIKYLLHPNNPQRLLSHNSQPHSPWLQGMTKK